MPRVSKLSLSFSSMLIFLMMVLMGQASFSQVYAKADLRIIEQQVKIKVEERTMQATMSDRPTTVQSPTVTDSVPIEVTDDRFVPIVPEPQELPQQLPPDKVYLNWFGGWVSLYRRDGQLFLRLFKSPTAQDL